jgi:hypothetical protein
MSRPMVLFSIALLVAPALTYLIYRLAKGLGYLDPPATKEQEYRRTVSASLYAFLLFLPVFIYGYEKGWPRIWVIFAAVNGIVLFLFAVIGSRTAMRLWKLRHPESDADREARRNPPEDPS